MIQHESQLGASLAERLTRREQEVLAWLAEGLTAPEIAQKLTLAVSSVKSHLQHVYSKLGVNSRRNAVAKARNLGWLPLPGTVPLAAGNGGAPFTPKHNLPQPLTRLIGRESELQALKQVLTNDQQAPDRMVTLVGPGGVGKTRLCLAVGHDVLHHFRDNIWLVELAPLSEAEGLASTVAAALGLNGNLGVSAHLADRPELSVVTDFLRSKHGLLILDNCEHLVDPCARLAEALLKQCVHLRILATSREPLGATGEVAWPVAGLDMPPAIAPADSAQPPAQYAALELFAERARAARPSFRVTRHNVASVTHICQQLDGLPLAIELAAARVALLPVEQIAARLAAQDGLRLLTGGGRTALPRHQTLLAAIEWSYQLLAEPEQRLLRRLTVFVGGWSLEAAEIICADRPGDEAAAVTPLPATEVLDALGRLAAKSLVVSEVTASGEARFRLLATIREFALGKLEASGEAPAMRQRHFDCFLALAEQAEPETRGPNQLVWFDRLTLEHDNLRRALDWAVQHQAIDDGLRLATALHYFWEVRGRAAEAGSWYKRLLAADPTPQRSVAWALGMARAARTIHRVCDMECVAEAGQAAQASLAVARDLGEAGYASAGYALIELGSVRLYQQISPYTSTPDTLHSSVPRDAGAILQESLALFERVGDNWGRASALQWHGRAAIAAGEAQRAISDFEHSRALFERLGDSIGMSRVTVELAELAAWRGDHQQARDLYEAAVTQFRRLGAREGSANALALLGVALGELGCYERAMASLDEAALVTRNLGQLQQLRWQLSAQATVAYDYGRYEEVPGFLEASRLVAVEAGDDDWLAMLDMFRARLVRAQGNPAEAVKLIGSAMLVFEAHGHVWWRAFANRALGEAWRDEGDTAQALAYTETSLAFFQERWSHREITELLVQLGGVCRRRGEYGRAAEVLGQGLERCLASGQRRILAVALAECAYLAAALAPDSDTPGPAEHAAWILGAHQTLCDAISLELRPADQAERFEYERTLDALNHRLGEEKVRNIWAAGAAQSTDTAAGEAQARLRQYLPEAAVKNLPL